MPKALFQFSELCLAGLNLKPALIFYITAFQRYFFPKFSIPKLEQDKKEEREKQK